MESAAVYAEAFGHRPLLRGALHAAATPMAILGLVILILLAGSPREYVGAALYASSLILLYATSAGYHRIAWATSFRQLARRLDHAMIFVLIAGTYTPFCLLTLSNAWGIPMLSVVWGLAGLGIVVKLVWPGAPKWVGVPLYLGVGWLAPIAASQLVTRMEPEALVLLALGGVVYSAGGLVYALERPDPWPRVFGYHEVFHALVVMGSVIHYALVALYLMPR